MEVARSIVPGFYYDATWSTFYIAHSNNATLLIFCCGFSSALSLTLRYFSQTSAILPSKTRILFSRSAISPFDIERVAVDICEGEDYER